MSFFDFALYAVAVIATLAIYGSSRKSAGPAEIPAAAEPTLADFAAAPEPAPLAEEAIAALFPLKAVDAVVPFRRRTSPAAALEALSIRELRQLAKRHRISKYSRKSKAELVRLIAQLQAA